MQKRAFKIWYVGYLLLLLATIFYVKTVLKRSDIKVNKGKEQQSAVEEKFVNVEITVDNGKTIRNYKTKLKNIDSVYDALDKIHDADGFYYEITGYLYGTEIDCVNELCRTEGYKWEVYKDGQKITNVIKETNLEDDAKIELKMEKLQ
ncbi:hypothetical protein GYA27_01710 [candidate division WWE3 bacterium]|uniref:DUF4430 domain-containing protein n=1 Tax=candidate division WWE3 bacterium TaxID=2053526 RepID=A0A7X9DK20_UNCKA|nr:hypothetical protein [candidate division WWE3 bacterium]